MSYRQACDSHWNHLPLTFMLNWWSVTVKKTPHSPYTLQPNNIPTHYLQSIFPQHETRRQYFRERHMAFTVYHTQTSVDKQINRFKRDSVGTKQEMQHWASSSVQFRTSIILWALSLRLTAIPHLEIMQWLHVTKLFSPKYPILTLTFYPKSSQKEKKKSLS